MRFRRRRLGFPFFRWRRPFFWGSPFFWRRRLFGPFTYLLVGGLIYKIYSEDVRRMEERYSKKNEDMSVEELKDAMRKMGVSRLEISPSDLERVKRY